MTRFGSLSLMVLSLFIAPLAFVGCSDEATVIEPPEEYVPSEIDKEMESEDYEKAMNEMK